GGSGAGASDRGAAGRAALGRSAAADGRAAASAEEAAGAGGSAAASAASAAARAAAAEAGRAGSDRYNGTIRHKGSPMQTTRRTFGRLMAMSIVALPLAGCSYNRFVSQEEAIKAQWAQVENQLQRRNDLIPNLVETVKGYAQHEESVFKDVADARTQLLSAKSPEEKIGAANRETSALGRLLAIAENYPQLKANEQ